MPQKNISIDAGLKRDFEEFCAENAYTENAVFGAAFLVFQKMPHEERKKWFKALAGDPDPSTEASQTSGPIGKIGGSGGARKKGTAAHPAKDPKPPAKS